MTVLRHECRDASELLHDFVQGRDVPCPGCGYNLRNTTSERCPECGAALQLRVNTPRVRAGAWIVALLAAALPLGFDLTMLGVAGYAIYARWKASGAGMMSRYSALSPTDHRLMLTLAGSSAAYALLLYIITRSRHWLASRSLHARSLIVLMWTGALLAAHVYLLDWTFRTLDQYW